MLSLIVISPLLRPFLQSISFFKVPLSKVPSQEIDNLIERINLCYAKSKLKIEECIATHQVLKEELESRENGASARKHLLQQVRILT